MLRLLLVLFATALFSTATAAADHLLISEILIDSPGDAPTENDTTSSEFLEIYNPTAAAINLTNHIITDYPNYHVLPAGSFEYGDGGDCMLRFPAGAILAPEQIAVVTQSAATFFEEVGAPFGQTAAGFAAQPGSPLLFEINDTNPAVPQMINLKAIAAAPRPLAFSRTNGGEFIALIYWNGQSDLVADIDIVSWGLISGGNLMIDKTGIEIDGPDIGPAPTAYKTDIHPDYFIFNSPTDALSRTTDDEAFELKPNGNGITDHDETTENPNATFTETTNTETTPGLPHPDLAPASINQWSQY